MGQGAVELEALINRLNHTTPLLPSQAEALYKAQSDRMISAALKGSVSEALASRRELTILSQPEDGFRSELDAIKDDIRKQVAVVDEAFDLWFETGAIVPPHYAWRIAVILSKAKRVDEERAFLAAWCRHFGDRIGGRFSSLAERAQKRGATS